MDAYRSTATFLCIYTPYCWNRQPEKGNVNPRKEISYYGITICRAYIVLINIGVKFSNLCLSKDNWPKWSQKIVEVMEMSELDEYLSGTVPIPDASVDAGSLRNWKGNNKKLIRFLKAYIEDGEKTFLATDNAHTAWTNLRNRHEKQGPITQVRL